MWDFNLLAATRTIEKSMPYVLYRLLICLGVALGYLLAALAAAGTVIGIASLSSNPAALAQFGAVLGFAAFGFLMYKLRPAWLHGVKAGQLALLAEQAKGQALPEGKAQIDYAKQLVARRFPRASELFELDHALKRILAEFAEVPPASDSGSAQNPQIAKISARMTGQLLAANDQAVLAWHFYTGTDDPWRSTATALAGIARNPGSLLKNRMYGSAFEGLGFAVAFAVLLIPFQKIAAALPISVGFWLYVFTAVFAWTFKAAFFEPIVQAAMMQCLFPMAERGGDPQQEAELSRRSEAFRALQEKAGSAAAADRPG